MLALDRGEAPDESAVFYYLKVMVESGTEVSTLPFQTEQTTSVSGVTRGSLSIRSLAFMARGRLSVQF